MTEIRGVQVTGARIAPILDKTLIGTCPGRWSVDPRMRKTLERARAAVGAQVLPDEEVQLIVDMAVDPHGGSTGPVRVLYTDTEDALHVYD